MTGSVKTQLKQAIPSLVIMLVIVIAASLASDNFFRTVNIRNIFTQTAVLSIAAVAQCLVLFIGGIDMSIGSVVSFSTIAIAIFSGDSINSLILSFIIALGVGVLTGAVNGIGVVKFKIPAMIITISTQALLKGICLILMPSSGGAIHKGFSAFIRAKHGIVSNIFVCAMIIYVLAFVVLHYTQFGRKIYAIGNSEQNASQSGIEVNKMIILVYILAGAAAAVAGILLSTRISSGNALVGDTYSMDSVTAAVIGGISMNGGVGSVPGALLGALILTLINNTMNNLGISPYYQYIMKGTLLMLSILLFQIKRRRPA